MFFVNMLYQTNIIVHRYHRLLQSLTFQLL